MFTPAPPSSSSDQSVSSDSGSVDFFFPSFKEQKATSPPLELELRKERLFFPLCNIDEDDDRIIKRSLKQFVKNKVKFVWRQYKMAQAEEFHAANELWSSPPYEYGKFTLVVHDEE